MFGALATYQKVWKRVFGLLLFSLGLVFAQPFFAQPDQVPFLVPLPAPFPDAALGEGADALCLGDHIFIQDGAVIRNITIFLLTLPGLDYSTQTIPKGAYDLQGRTLLRDGTQLPLAKEGIQPNGLGTSITFSQTAPGTIIQYQYTLKAPHPKGTLSRGETWKNPLFISLGHPFATKTSAVHVMDRQDNRVMFFPGAGWKKTRRPGSQAVTWLNSLESVPPGETASGPLVGAGHLLVVGTYNHKAFFSQDLGTWEGLGRLWYEKARQLGPGERQVLAKWNQIGSPGLPKKLRYGQVFRLLTDHGSSSMAMALKAFTNRGLSAHLTFFQEQSALTVDERLPGMGWFSEWGIQVEVGDQEVWYFLPNYPGYLGGTLPQPFNGGSAWVLTHARASHWLVLPKNLDPGVQEWFNQDYTSLQDGKATLKLNWTISGPRIRNILFRQSTFNQASELTSNQTSKKDPAKANLDLALVAWLQRHCQKRGAHIVPGSLSTKMEETRFTLRAEIQLDHMPISRDGKFLLRPFGFSWLPFGHQFKPKTRRSSLQLPSTYRYREEITLPVDLIGEDWQHQDSAGSVFWRQSLEQKQPGQSTLVRSLEFSNSSLTPELYTQARDMLVRMAGAGTMAISLGGKSPQEKKHPVDVAKGPKSKSSLSGPYLTAALLQGPNLGQDSRSAPTLELLQPYLPLTFMEAAGPPSIKQKNRLSHKSDEQMPGSPLLVLDYLFTGDRDRDAQIQDLMAIAAWQNRSASVFFRLFFPEKKRDRNHLDRWKAEELSVQTYAADQDIYKGTALQVPRVDHLKPGLPFGVRVLVVAENELMIPPLPLQNLSLQLSGFTLFLDHRKQTWRPRVSFEDLLTSPWAWSKEGTWRVGKLGPQPLLGQTDLRPMMHLDPSEVFWQEQNWPYQSWHDLADLFRAFSLQGEDQGSNVSGSQKTEENFFQVKQNIRYVPHALGTRGYLPFSPRTTQALGWGDCKDMANLLWQRCPAKAETYLALVHTQPKENLDAEHPSLWWFNHVVVAKKNPGDKKGWTILDATAKFLEPGEVRHDLYDKTFLILSNPPVFYKMDKAKTSPSRLFLDISVTRQDHDLLVDVHEITSGPLMRWLEPHWHNSSREKAQQHLQDQAAQFAGLAEKVSMDTIWQDPEGRLHVQYHFVVPQGAPRESNLKPVQLPGPWTVSPDEMDPDAPPHRGQVTFHTGPNLRLYDLYDPTEPVSRLTWEVGGKIAPIQKTQVLILRTVSD